MKKKKKSKKNKKNRDEDSSNQSDFKNRCELLYDLVKENSSIYQILDEYSDYFIDSEKFKLAERGKKNRT